MLSPVSYNVAPFLGHSQTCVAISKILKKKKKDKTSCTFFPLFGVYRFHSKIPQMSVCTRRSNYLIILLSWLHSNWTFSTTTPLYYLLSHYSIMICVVLSCGQFSFLILLDQLPNIWHSWSFILFETLSSLCFLDIILPCFSPSVAFPLSLLLPIPLASWC